MLQTNTKLGRVGASRQSWSIASPRDMLKKIMAENPRASQEELLVLFEGQVRENERHLSMVIEYWFTNNYRSFLRATPDPVVEARRKEDLQKRVNEARQKVEKVIQRKVEIRLLSLKMPNGKKLADCTGKDCAALASKVGPWLQAIAGKLKPSQTVGKTLSEAEVKALYASPK